MELQDKETEWCTIVALGIGPYTDLIYVRHRIWTGYLIWGSSLLVPQGALGISPRVDRIDTALQAFSFVVKK